MFAAETSKAVDTIAKFFGPAACLYISQDDKASVPIGKTAGGVETILNLNEWLKSPYQLVSEI